MTKTVSSIWNFAKASGNMEMDPSKTRHEEVSDEHSDESSNEIGNKGAPPEKGDIHLKLSLLKKNGAEKFRNEDFGGALADFDAAYDIEPECAATLKYRAEIKRILFRYDGALEDLNRADQIDPNNLFILSTRGAVHKELKNFKTALKDLDKANELNCKHHFTKTQRGVVKRSLRDFEGALVDLTEANILNPNQAYILAQLGVVMRELGKLNEASQYLDTAHKLDAKNSFVYQQRGVVRRELGDLEGALDDLNKAHAIIPKDSYTLRRRGITRRELLDYQGSLDDLNMANVLEPYNDLTLNELGVTKKVLGDFQGAIEDLTMANHIRAEQAFTLKHRGSANRELGNLVDALRDLSYADNLEPNDFFTLSELGRTKVLVHDYNGALLYYNKVMEMEPNDPAILQQRGSLRRNLDDFQGSLEDFEKVAKLQLKLQRHTLLTVVERCHTKYAMKDVAGALEDAKMVRKLWGEHGQSSMKGEQLKAASTRRSVGPSELSASSFSQRLNDIEILTSSHYLLWIEHRRLLFLKDLGRGSYGYVQKRKWVDKNKDVAVKFVTSEIKDAFEYEVRMLAKIQHPRVVRLIGCSYDEEEKQGLLVMELMQSNLRTLIDSKKRENGPPFDLPVAVDIMKKIAEAMEYLHEQGVLHRDLKSSNVLVNKIEDGKEEYVVKIADFGMARMQRKNNTTFFMTVDVGATLWRAPEVFKNEKGTQSYSFPADVWSYGITCYEVLTGEVPFEGITCAQLRKNILCGLRPDLPKTCPSVLKLLLMRCLSLMPYDRPNFSNIHKVLKLYLGIITSREFRDHRSGDAIRPHELRRHFKAG